MRKWLATMLCAALLLSLCACGGESDYDRGMRLIAEGRYTEAYTALKASDDPRAAEEVAKLVFVPTRKEYKNVTSGRETVDEYTYDAAGNLLTHTYNGALHQVYTYDEQNRVVKIQNYTYSELRETVNTYDERGNLLSHKVGYVGTNDFEWNTYTYDEQNRILTHRTHHLYDGEEYRLDRIYHYAADGTYYWEAVDPGEGRIRQYYDAANRELKFVEYNDADEEIILSEYRYDGAGNVVYDAQFPKLEVSRIIATVYNEKNQPITRTTELVDEGTETETYTYDEQGNCLSYVYQGVHATKTETYTYDEAGHRIGKKLVHSDGSSRQYTYTYNEDGTVKTMERQGTDGTMTTAYGYDTWGNRTTMLCYADRNEEKGVVTWQLCYYPHGVPEEVVELIQEPPFETWMR